jgi:hypothetical protein
MCTLYNIFCHLVQTDWRPQVCIQYATSCRLLAQAMCLTGSDLNSSAKPWDIQFNVSKNVYAEFHDQVCHPNTCLPVYWHRLCHAFCGKKPSSAFWLSSPSLARLAYFPAYSISEAFSDFQKYYLQNWKISGKPFRLHQVLSYFIWKSA